ncbi:MAG: nuclear transport factor 2 family protein [Clostridiales bacterium]|nr:nuclear transport factor 2 family protein [Clostridiales bacterium]
MDTREIKEVIQLYFDGSFDGKADNMRRVFHPSAHIYGIAQGNLEDMPKEAFAALVGSRPADAPAFPREEEILSIDFTGENTAVARVKLRVFDIRYTDILSFIRLDGEWSVIAKLFSGVQV